MDGVFMAVLAKRLARIAVKMQNTLFRTARSGVINTARDFSCCILTAEAELLAVGESLPIHVMVGADMMAKSMAAFHPQLRRGDAFLHNSPYHGCSHAADLSVLVPVIDDQGIHRFTVMAKAHQADIGNSIPTTVHASARDVYEEGALIFPAVKVQEDFRDIEDIIRMCMMRIRVPEQWRGDYLAQLGAARIGERELLRLGADVGWATLASYVRAWFDYSERRMASVLRRLPSDRATGLSVHDPFPGTPADGIPVKATVAVDGAAATIEVDLRDNPDCLPCGLNVNDACAASAAMIGIFNGLPASGVPTNAGSFRRIRVLMREDCVVGLPRHPMSYSVATMNVSERVTNAVQTALAALGEGLGMAGFGAITSAANPVISGEDPRAGGAPFVNALLLGDTVGAAAPSADAWLTTINVGAAGLSHYDSVEIDELRHPIRVHERRLVADSEGAGTFRGAPASHVGFGPVDCSLQAIYQSDGVVNAPLGVRGGLPGAPARNYKRAGSGEVIALGGWGEVVLAPADTIFGISCGGGGYGPPLGRDPARVGGDVAEGYITAERAETVYGVILTAGGTVDEAATQRRRNELASGPS